MTTLFIDRKNADIDADPDRVVVRVAGERSGTIPLKPLDRVVVQGSARLTTRFLLRLVANGVGLLVLGGRKRMPSAALIGQPGSDASLRLAQVRMLGRETARLVIARELVGGKIKGQCEVLKAGEAQRGRTQALNRALEVLSTALDKTAAVPSRSALLGLEGAAAAAYFGAFTTLFAPTLGFQGRNRRPPRDPVNACLSLGYTVLHFDAVRAAAVEGLDPMVGIYHEMVAGRESLACDLAEPFRAEIDRFVWRLFADKALQAENFREQDGACLLDKAGRRVFYEAYEGVATGFRPRLARMTRDLVSTVRASDGTATTTLPHQSIERSDDGP